jgi:hypothetical protein
MTTHGFGLAPGTVPRRGLGEAEERARRQMGSVTPRCVMASRPSKFRTSASSSTIASSTLASGTRTSDPHLDAEHADDRERDRQRDRHLGADADLARDVDDAAELADVRLDDVHPDPAPGEVGRLFSGREAGMKTRL